MTDANSKDGIRRRKIDHIELCAKEDVEQRLTTTLLEEVHLMHQSIPELNADAIDMSVEMFGKRLVAPFCITGMTGGAKAAVEINRTLAAVAEARGFAFGVGSQRAMLIDPELTSTYAVREVAPTALIFANIGLVQATTTKAERLAELVEAIGADALCIHMNPAQEMIQEGGDRDFRGGREALARLNRTLNVPIIAKETGCGISPRTAAHIKSAGVGWVDTSGAGGTTWIGVEALRARPGRKKIGEDFWEWGIPTAASVLYARAAGLNVIASGGLRNGHDAARAIALGASLTGMALPWLRAVKEGGAEQADALADHLVESLRVAMLLTDSADIGSLQMAPRIIGPTLERWTRSTR